MALFCKELASHGGKLKEKNTSIKNIFLNLKYF